MSEVKNTNHALRFIYEGVVRHVDNVTVEPNTVIGFEMRKGGKFSYKIKRYSKLKMKNTQFILPFKRKGPVIGIERS